jgi:hypothetical protein
MVATTRDGLKSATVIFTSSHVTITDCFSHEAQVALAPATTR